MRKLIVSEFLSLDGVMEAPEKWVFTFKSKAVEAFKLQEMLEVDALLLGAVTYGIFEGSWPTRTGELAERMNSVRKHVVARGSSQLAWNNSQLVEGDLIDSVAKLKQQSGMDILVVGSGALAQKLMQHDLIDEYRLLVYPIVLGRGKRLFIEDVSARLNHLEARSMDGGIVLLRYAPCSK